MSETPKFGGAANDKTPSGYQRRRCREGKMSETPKVRGAADDKTPSGVAALSHASSS